MSKKPKISVVVAAYNIADFISQCFESIISQTYDNYEVIVINDGSTDNTLSICQSYAKKHANFIVINQKNQGLSAVRNRGVKESTGEYITFVDGDDYLAPDYLQKLYQNLQTSKSEISVCGFTTFPNQAIELPRQEILSGQDATIKLLTEQDNYQIVSWNKLYKKSLFENIAFPIGKIHEDSLTTYKLFAAADKVSFLNESLYFYRQRKGSIMDQAKLYDRLNTKLLAATEAKTYFKKQPTLLAAAEISELLAYFAFLDNIIASNLDVDPTPYFKWLKNHQAELSKNPHLSAKLKVYLHLATMLGGTPYQLFRKIKH